MCSIELISGQPPSCPVNSSIQKPVSARDIVEAGILFQTQGPELRFHHASPPIATALCAASRLQNQIDTTLNLQPRKTRCRN
jgi:hypothetical protein